MRLFNDEIFSLFYQENISSSEEIQYNRNSDWKYRTLLDDGIYEYKCVDGASQFCDEIFKCYIKHSLLCFLEACFHRYLCNALYSQFKNGEVEFKVKSDTSYCGLLQSSTKTYSIQVDQNQFNTNLLNTWIERFFEKEEIKKCILNADKSILSFRTELDSRCYLNKYTEDPEGKISVLKKIFTLFLYQEIFEKQSFSAPLFKNKAINFNQYNKSSLLFKKHKYTLMDEDIFHMLDHDIDNTIEGEKKSIQPQQEECDSLQNKSDIMDGFRKFSVVIKLNTCGMYKYILKKNTVPNPINICTFIRKYYYSAQYFFSYPVVMGYTENQLSGKICKDAIETLGNKLYSMASIDVNDCDLFERQIPKFNTLLKYKLISLEKSKIKSKK